MKNKTLIKFAAGLFFSVLMLWQAFSAQNTFGPNLLTGTNHNFFTNGILIQRITVVTTNMGTTPAQVWFYDSNTNSYLFNQAAYTNRSQYLTNLVTTFTNIAGATENFTNQYLVGVQTVQIATTNSFRLINTFIIGTNGTWIYTPVNPLPAALGVTLTNNISVSSVTFDYSNLK